MASFVNLLPDQQEIERELVAETFSRNLLDFVQ
jgi:hypothetical protein